MNCATCGQPAVPGATFCLSCGRPLAVASASNPVAYAGFWRRLLALIIDGTLFALTSVLIVALAGWADRTLSERIVFDLDGGGAQWWTTIASTTATVLPWLLAWAYFALSEALPWQGTPGKRLVGIRVTDVAGRRASVIRTTLRNAFKPLSAGLLMFGYLMAAFTGRKQALHDLITGCLMMTGPRS